MKKILGKDVFESVEEIVSAEHTALLIIDMQNGLASPKGYASRQGDVSIQHQRSIIPNIQRVLGAARSSGVAVIHVKVVFDLNMGSTSPASIYDGQRMRNFGSYWGHPPSKQREPDLETLVDDTWESEFIPELFPISSEFIVKKHRNSAFVNTNMDQVLRSNRVQSVVVTGTSTAGCVLATALDALWFDYYAVVVSDCIADCFPERHKAGLAILNERFDMPTGDEIIDMWSKKAGDTVTS